MPDSLPDPLLDALARWSAFDALVVGDLMLDELVYGDAERLSADAPVPILHAKRVERRPGGAANLALDLAALGGRVGVVGLAGEDEEAEHLRRALEEGGIDAGGVLGDASRPTTVKRNLIGLAAQRHPQKMFRVDFESREPARGELARRLLAAVRERLPRVQLVCLEDYAKGVCSPEVCRLIIDEARSVGVPVLVDPAKLDSFERYRGATAITPNRNEAEHATGLSSCADGSPEGNAALADRLQKELDAEAVVLTLDRHGALVLERGGEPESIPTVAREVYDVTGAGDMMLAGLAAGRANGLSWRDATRLANAAAGLEVEVFGVVPIPIASVHHQLLLEHAGDGTLRDTELLRAELETRRAKGERIVLTNGCFDVLHSGHVTLIERAAQEGDFLVVAINADETVRRYKGPNRPVHSARERATVLGGLGAVGCVVVYDEDTPVELIEQLRPDVLVKGDEYTLDQIPGATLVQSYGGRVVRVPMLEGHSTTGVLTKLGHEAAEVTTSDEERAKFIDDRS